MASSTQVHDVFRFPEQTYGKATTIDADFLQKNPMKNGKPSIGWPARKISSLTLSGIEEQDVKSILPLFPALRYFSLQKVTIIQNETFRGLPKGIESLHLADCKITKDVVQGFFKSIGKRLLSVKIERCRHAPQYDAEGSFTDLLKYLPDSIRHLSFHDPICNAIGLHDLPPSLEYCHLHMPREDFFLRCDSYGVDPRVYPLKTLITKLDLSGPGPVKALENLKKLRNLDHLRVLNSIDVIVQSQLQSLKLKTLDIHCFSPPDKANLILTLNDDCLLHVLSFLGQHGCMAMSQVHPRLERLIAAYIYSREYTTINSRFLNDFSDLEKKAIRKSLEQHATWVMVIGEDWPKQISRFKKLERIDVIMDLTNAGIKAIPNGLKKLHLEEPIKGGKELFLRLCPSLTSLKLKGHFEPNELSGLKNLRELRLEEYKGSDLSKILLQNKDHLERLKIDFYEKDFADEFEFGYSPYGYPPPFGYGFDPDDEIIYGLDSDEDDEGEDISESDFPLCPMKSLKRLHLTSISCHFDLKPSDFPSLENIYVCFGEMNLETKTRILNSIKKFDQLKTLKVNMEMSLEWLSTFQKLEHLCMNLNKDKVLDVIQILPNLRRLGWFFDLDFKTEDNLRRYLLAEKRSIKFRSGLVLP